MPKFQVVVEHRSDRAKVAQQLQAFADKVREDMAGQVTQVVETWDEHGNLDFSFKALGFSVSGRMEHAITAVSVQGTIPFAALPFRGAIEQKIAETIREIIEKDS